MPRSSFQGTGYPYLVDMYTDNPPREVDQMQQQPEPPQPPSMKHRARTTAIPAPQYSAPSSVVHHMTPRHSSVTLSPSSPPSSLASTTNVPATPRTETLFDSQRRPAHARNAAPHGDASRVALTRTPSVMSSKAQTATATATMAASSSSLDIPSVVSRATQRGRGGSGGPPTRVPSRTASELPRRQRVPTTRGPGSQQPQPCGAAASTSEKGSLHLATPCTHSAGDTARSTSQREREGRPSLRGTPRETLPPTQADRGASAVTVASSSGSGAEETRQTHGYVAQSAYTQRNIFRRQDFAEFTSNPQYRAPAGFRIYPQAMATRVYGLEASRATQGEFMVQRLIDSTHPATEEERSQLTDMLSSTLMKVQRGDWFFKWTRINRVHQRYVWLNLQRGTLMWSLSPKQTLVLTSELKLSSIVRVVPDCLHLGAPARAFYRMTINTHDRCISFATEIRAKFDMWYRLLLQLTTLNLSYGIPSVWGRPSSSNNATGRGAESRWTSRYSPLFAILLGAGDNRGDGEGLRQMGIALSSD